MRMSTAPFTLRKSATSDCARVHPFAHANRGARVLLARAKRCACIHARVSDAHVHLRDAKMRTQDAATGCETGSPLFSQLPVLLASFSPTIRDEREGGRGYKK